MSFELLTKEEAAQRARISRRLLYRLIERGEGPSVTRIGGRAFIRTDVLQAWLESCTASVQKAA